MSQLSLQSVWFHDRPRWCWDISLYLQYNVYLIYYTHSPTAIPQKCPIAHSWIVAYHWVKSLRTILPLPFLYCVTLLLTRRKVCWNVSIISAKCVVSRQTQMMVRYKPVLAVQCILDILHSFSNSYSTKMFYSSLIKCGLSLLWIQSLRTILPLPFLYCITLLLTRRKVCWDVSIISAKCVVSRQTQMMVIQACTCSTMYTWYITLILQQLFHKNVPQLTHEVCT